MKGSRKQPMETELKEASDLRRPASPVVSGCLRLSPSSGAHLSGDVSVVPAMAPDVGGAQLQLLLQLLAEFLRRRLQQVLVFGELGGQRTQVRITISSLILKTVASEWLFQRPGALD